MATAITTPITWTNLVAGKIISLADLGVNLSGRLRAAQWQVQVDLWGNGGTFDAITTWTRSASKLTMSTASAVAYTPTGHRLNLVKTDPFAALQNVPFEDDGVSTYRIMARWNDGPQLTLLGGVNGTDGQPHYPTLQEFIGRIFEPDSVTQDGAGTLKLTITNQLYQGEKFASLTDSRLCLFWYADPVSGGPYKAGQGGLAAGPLKHEGAGVYSITPLTVGTDLLLGNPAADLTASNFRVLMIGPTILKDGTDTLTGDALAQHVELTRLLGTVFDGSSSPLINNVGNWIAAFNAEHDNTTGHHLDVTADTIDVQAVADSSNNPLAVIRRQDGTSMIELRTHANADATAGEVRFANVDQAAGTVCRLIAHTAASQARMEITGTVGATAVFDGAIRKNVNKTSIGFAIQGDKATTELLTFENVGAGDLDLLIVDGELRWSGTGRLNGTNSGAGHFMIELDVGTGCQIDAIGGIDAQSVEAAEGFAANPVTSNQGYAYVTGEEPTILIDYPPGAGGWTSDQDPTTIRLNYTDLGAHPNVAGAALELRHPIEFLNKINGDVVRTVTIEQLDLVFEKNAGTDAVWIRLHRFKRDGTGTIETVAAVDGTATGARTTESDTALAHTFDATYLYWLELQIESTTTNTDAKAYNVRIHFTESAIA